MLIHFLIFIGADIAVVTKDTVTGIKSQTLSSATAQGLRFEGVTTGIDATTGSSFLALIDSTAVDTNTVLVLGSGAAVVENLIAESGVKIVRIPRSQSTTYDSAPLWSFLYISLSRIPHLMRHSTGRQGRRSGGCDKLHIARPDLDQGECIHG